MGAHVKAVELSSKNHHGPMGKNRVEAENVDKDTFNYKRFNHFSEKLAASPAQIPRGIPVRYERVGEPAKNAMTCLAFSIHPKA